MTPQTMQTAEDARRDVRRILGLNTILENPEILDTVKRMLREMDARKERERREFIERLRHEGPRLRRVNTFGYVCVGGYFYRAPDRLAEWTVQIEVGEGDELYAIPERGPANTPVGAHEKGTTPDPRLVVEPELRASELPEALRRVRLQAVRTSLGSPRPQCPPDASSDRVPRRADRAPSDRGHSVLRPRRTPRPRTFRSARSGLRTLSSISARAWAWFLLLGRRLRHAPRGGQA